MNAKSIAFAITSATEQAGKSMNSTLFSIWWHAWQTIRAALEATRLFAWSSTDVKLSVIVSELLCALLNRVAVLCPL